MAPRGSSATRISRRLPRHPVERVEQPFAPGIDRIVLRQQLERADHPRPLERAEHDIVGIVRIFAAEDRAASSMSAAAARAICESLRPPCRGRPRFLPAACRSAPRASSEIGRVLRLQVERDIGDDERKHAADHLRRPTSSASAPRRGRPRRRTATAGPDRCLRDGWRWSRN